MSGMHTFLHQDVITGHRNQPGTAVRGVLVRATRDSFYLEHAQIGMIAPFFDANYKSEDSKLHGRMRARFTNINEIGPICLPRDTSLQLTKNADFVGLEPIDGPHLLDREMVKIRARKKIQEIKNRNKPGLIAERIEKVKDALPEFLATIVIVAIVSAIVLGAKYAEGTLIF